jgi:hypothetical protein
MLVKYVVLMVAIVLMMLAYGVNIKFYEIPKLILMLFGGDTQIL